MKKKDNEMIIERDSKRKIVVVYRSRRQRACAHALEVHKTNLQPKLKRLLNKAIRDSHGHTIINIEE